MIEWTIAAASLIGVVANIQKRRICFAIWFVTNTAWVIIDFCAGIYAQSALMAVYAGLAVWGWFSWRPTD